MQQDFAMYKQIKSHPFSKASSLQFSLDGKMVLAATSESKNETITIYDTQTAKLIKTVYSKKYGLGDLQCVRFAQSTSSTATILHASSKEDDIIRYLSLHDNSYIRYFKGHKSKVDSMDTSKVNDMFISSSQEDVRLWDLRSPMCSGVLHTQSKSVVAIDPEGVVFGVGTDTIRLYDMRNFDKGPFGMAPQRDQMGYLQKTPGEQWTSMEFSPNQVDLQVSTTHGRIFVLDSVACMYKQTLRTTLQGLQEASFTPDGGHLIASQQEGVRVFNVNDPQRVVDLGCKGVKLAKMNPRYGMMATATDKEVQFWLPYFNGE